MTALRGGPKEVYTTTKKAAPPERVATQLGWRPTGVYSFDWYVALRSRWSRIGLVCLVLLQELQAPARFVQSVQPPPTTGTMWSISLLRSSQYAQGSANST